jgi:6-phosphogluconolactonase
VYDAPKPPPSRLTLTLPAVTAARVVVLAAFGDAKRAAMDAVLHDPTSTLPASRLLRAASRAVVLMDHGAAGPADPSP